MRQGPVRSVGPRPEEVSIVEMIWPCVPRDDPFHDPDRLLHALQGQASFGQGQQPVDFRFLFFGRYSPKRKGAFNAIRLHPEPGRATHEIGILIQAVGPLHCKGKRLSH